MTYREFNETYDIPTYTDIEFAKIYVNLYSGSGSANWPMNAEVKLDGNGDGIYETILGNELLSSTSYSKDGTIYWINDHVTRCYSDYQLFYDASGLITTTNPSVYVKTSQVGSDSYDGRLKMMALIAAYNDGDNDKVNYWVNAGQDWINSTTSPSHTTFNTSNVTGFTDASLNTVAVSSKDGSYTFNGHTFSGTDPVAPVNNFETHTFDVTDYVTADAESTLTYALTSGSSFKNVLATLTVTEGPDLIVTNITANPGAGEFMFASEPNMFNVTVKNNGTVASAASTVNVTVNGVIYTANVPALNPGASAIITITDTLTHTAGDNVPVNANTDPSNNIPETNETNNSYATTFTVYNNGYKGKRYTGGSDLTTKQTWSGKYDVIYSNGNTTYNGSYWSAKTYNWTSSNLIIPSGATVVSARLYQTYTFNKMASNPAWTMQFNDVTALPIVAYTDRKGYGSYNYPGGMYVYDVTSLFNVTGNNMTITPEAGNDYGIYGAYLVVVYQDPTTSNKTIYINDEFDMLYSGTSRSVTNEEGTAYATFNSVSTTKLVNAEVITITGSSSNTDINKSKFFFNTNEYAGFWSDYLSGPQIGFSTYDVTSAILNGSNTGLLQSYIDSGSGDNMVAFNSILVTEYDSTAPTINTIDPTKNAVNVPTNKVITLTFSEPIKEGNMNIELKNSTGTVIPITTSINNNVLTINHASLLSKGATYSLILGAGSVIDNVGNPLAAYSLSFTTSTDATKPIVTAGSPARNAVNVAADKVITTTFSEPIKAGNMWIELKSSNGTVIPITTSINGKVLTINHATLLNKATKYTIFLHTGSVTDIAGNPLTYYSRSFTTRNT